MAASINGATIPDSMADRGNYKPPVAEELGIDGEGAPILADYIDTQWDLDYLTDAEWQWWSVTLLSGLNSKLFSTASLWDDSRALVSWSRIRVHRPKVDHYENGEFRGVTIRFTGMIKA